MTTTTKTDTTKKTWKKKNIELIKLNKDKGVAEIEGIFLKYKDAGEQTNEETGEVRARQTAVFKKLDSDEKFQVWLNAGLKGALEMNDVTEGEAVRIVHLGKFSRTKGVGEVNRYDIYSM